MTHTGELPRSTPEAQGIASSTIHSFVEALEQRRLGVHSFILVRNGHIVADGWWKPYASHLPHMMFSLSKSFTSTAIGLAITEGRLSLDDPILSFFPSYVTAEIRDNMGSLLVRHLLSMSTGHAEDTFPPMVRSSDEDWVRTFLELPITYAPGTLFLYNTGASFMLSAILQSLTGQTLLDYLRPRLFEPLLIADPVWESNPRGINLGGSGLRLRTMDVAKFGQLYLQRGVWNGQRIVPEAWIEEATSVQIANGEDPDSDWTQGYGFQFWRCRHHAYRGDGAFGQFCLVMPQQQAVLAVTSGTYEMQGILNVVWEQLLPGLHAEPLTEQAQVKQALKERLARLAMPLPEALTADPSMAAQVSGRTIHLEANALHLDEIAFTFDESGTTFSMQDDKGTHHVITCGRTDWRVGASPLWYNEKRPVPIAAHGGWRDEHTFVMTWQYIETPFRRIITVEFDGDHVEISARPDLSFGEIVSERLHGRI
jgi:CubicO group peptidase (beta-lactamase class C family)